MCLLLSLRPKMLIALIRDESNTYYCKDFWLKRVPQLQVQWNLYLRPPLYNGHFFLAATVFGGQSIHWLLFEPLYNGLLSTTATSLCPQGVGCGGVQLYWWVTTVSHNLEEVLISSNRLEKSLNSVEVLEKYMISFLGLENTLTFTNNLVYATPFSLKLDC